MKSRAWIPLLLLCTMLLDVEADVAMAVCDPHPDHPGKCFDAVTRKAYAVGAEWYNDTSCEEYVCRRRPHNKFVIQVSGCCVVSADPPCVVVDGPSNTTYPDCCPTVSCL